MISHYCTRLRKGDLIQMGGAVYHVQMVNECRARAVPTEKVKVERTMFDKRTGEEKTVEFSCSGNGVNISPNSECQIVGHKSVVEEAPEPVTKAPKASKAKVTTERLNKAMKKLKRAA
jgi:hypothetical protein